MKFVLDVVPSTATAQGKRRSAKGVYFKAAREKEWIEVLTALLVAHRPDVPLEGPLCLRLTYVWPLTKLDENTKAKRKRLDAVPYLWHAQTPDFDNFPKSFCDAMQALNFYRDDKSIVHAEVFKLRGRRPMIIVGIVEADGVPYGVCS